jgi:hypothetical protein
VTGVEFGIEPDLSSLGELYPGMAPRQLPVSLTNPNQTPVYVTSLTVALAPGPVDCSAANFALGAAGVSEADPVVIPPGGAVRLPSREAGAPTIAMIDLPVDQDACQGIQLPLEFRGEAHG